MEGYDETNSGCVTAVLTFLDAWTRQLVARATYPACTPARPPAMTDLQTTTTHRRPSAGRAAGDLDRAVGQRAQPDRIALLSTAVWPIAARSKQYAGPHVVTVGGISLDIDSDLVDGPVARG